MINNRYILKKKLGEGRSKVFLCKDEENPGKDYAIKVLPENADANEIKIFRNEYFILQNLNHPNIISSHDEGTIVKTDDADIKTGSRFILLDYFPGVELLNYKRTNDEQILVRIIEQICTTLYYLHQSNYIYYDLKPENILVSEIEGVPAIKFIDMGFAHNLSSSDEYLTRGTREYIAPEILMKEIHNHQADLYSLGMLIYRIVYEKFPFTSESEIDIYKEHIENDFEFAESRFSNNLIEVAKKLLQKNPVNRYDNSLQILKNISTGGISQETTKHFIPANVFADRAEALEQINNFLLINKNKEVIILSGAEGAGKTSLLYKIYSDYDKTILISNAGKRGILFIQYLLKKIIFSDFVYSNLETDLLHSIQKSVTESTDVLISDLKSILTNISNKIKFNIIIDDFNLLDDFTLDVFKEILPILQVNGINIILSQRSDHPNAAGEIVNKSVTINLSPFSEDNLTLYLDAAFATFFPKDQLKKLIIKYADLLPGSIVNFIRDLILLNIIRFTYDGADIIEDDNTQKLLESSQDEIFKLRLSKLTPGELRVAEFISSFGSPPEAKIISGFNHLEIQDVYSILNNLAEKNVLQVSTIENSLNFTSDGLKKYIYSTINKKEEYHLKIAEYLSENFIDFNRNELSNHYEIAGKYIISYNILLKEIEEAERLSAFTYKKNILQHLLNLPLPEEFKINLSLLQALTLLKLNNAKLALSLINESLNKPLDENIHTEFEILKGSCLIEMGEHAEGKTLLSHLIKKINNEERKQKILVEIAYAEFDLGKFEVSEDYAKRILENENTSVEEKAKCYNLLGLIEIYLRNNLEDALREFEKSLDYYTQINSVLQEAKLERNIGNIYNMKGDHSDAEKYWNSAHKKNLSIGNLDQEAKHLLNYGIYYYELAAFDDAVKQYQQALEIFSVLGNRFGEGLALTNLGEVYIDSCNYSNAYNSLSEAKEIFNSLSNSEEKGEVLFLFGKFFSTIGAEDKLKDIVKEYGSSYSNGSERHKNNLKFLATLGNSAPDKKSIEEIKNKYLELNDITNYIKINIFNCETLLEQGDPVKAFDVINEEEFLQVCSKNSIVRAYREFLIGKIAEGNEVINIPNPLNNFIASYELLKDNDVTELTWKVMLKLGNIYFERGNYSKAKEYIVYAKKLIYFIADQIKEFDLREEYLTDTKKVNAITTLEFLEKELSQ